MFEIILWALPFECTSEHNENRMRHLRLFWSFLRRSDCHDEPKSPFALYFISRQSDELLQTCHQMFRLFCSSRPASVVLVLQKDRRPFDWLGWDFPHCLHPHPAGESKAEGSIHTRRYKIPRCHISSCCLLPPYSKGQDVLITHVTWLEYHAWVSVSIVGCCYCSFG